jgi:hypothetical protein
MDKAREGRSRRVHRRDWPGFLNRVVPAWVWQAFVAQVKPSKDPRVRWSAKYVVLAWMVMGWSLQSQLTERFREAGEFLGQCFARRRRPGESYQGLTKATARLGPAVFHRFWECLRATVPTRLGQTWTWLGWVVMAVDGSRIDAPRTRQNERGLGLAGRAKTHPQWWITWITHLRTNLIWDWRQGPGHSVERVHLRQMIRSLPKPLLLVADAGFGGFDLLWSLSRARIDFLIRCAGCTTLLVEGAFQKMMQEEGQQYVYLWPGNRRQRKPLRLRLIVLKRRGKQAYLLTNVLDSTDLSRPMASKIYAARWGIETEYRALKQTMGRRKVLAKTPQPGAAELSGNILALAMLVLQAAIVLSGRIARLSMALALKVMREAIETVRWIGRSRQFWMLLRSAVKDGYRRYSSKRARDWPHKKKDPPPGAPRLRSLTPRLRTRIMRLWSDYAAVLG